MMSIQFNKMAFKAIKTQAELTAYYNGNRKERWKSYLTDEAKILINKLRAAKPSGG